MEFINGMIKTLDSIEGVLEISILALAIVLATLIYQITKKILVRLIHKLIANSTNKIDDILVKRNVFNRLANLTPTLIIFLAGYLMPDQQAVIAGKALLNYQGLVQKLALAYMVLVIIQIFDALINSGADIYYKLKDDSKRSISGIIQIIKLLMYIIGGIFIIAIFLEKSPWGIISSIGALTAILMLVFRDTILSLVASFQISFNKTMQVGDWIEMPQFNADGDIIDITLNTVKIQNWDKTIVSVPTHKFLDESFKNWSGMSQAGGRRIKRNININQHSIKICTPAMLEKFKKISLLKDYLEQKEKEIRTYNKNHQITGKNMINGRRMTNIGTFRAYIRMYLEQHPQIHKKGMTLMVRQLDPGPKGLPLQIYCFTTDTRWVNYEAIQADIFDHLLAIIGEFELEVYQEPTGADFRRIM